MLAVELYNENTKLVSSVLKKLDCSLHGYEYEDFLQIGNIGLWNAARTYIQEDESRFSTYARRCIREELKRTMKCKENSLIETTYIEDEKYDLINRPAVDLDTKIMIKSYLNELDKKSRYVLVSLYIEDRPKYIVAKNLNMSKPRFNKYLNRILKTARKSIEYDNY